MYDSSRIAAMFYILFFLILFRNEIATASSSFSKTSLTTTSVSAADTLRVKSATRCGFVCHSRGTQCHGFTFSHSSAPTSVNCYLFRCINTDKQELGAESLQVYVSVENLSPQNLTNLALRK